MKRKNRRLVGLVWFFAVLLLLTTLFAAAFFLTAYLYQIAQWYPPPVAIQIINSVLGLAFMGLIMGGLARVAQSRGWMPEMNVFRPIIEALEKIAAGDFSIRLDNEFRDNRIVGELTASVNKMVLELDQMEQMRQEFISNVSHEIQSPLTSIRGFAQALQDDALSLDERHHYLAIIETESTRLSRITEDLLKLATLESDHVKFEPQPYRLDKQIRNVILACEPQWADKQIDMDVTLPEVTITADEDLLSQVWINLINNSIKFTPVGGRVCVNLQQQGATIEFKISDTGIGIAPEDQARVFERFYKADRSRTHANGGSGLGLSIVQKIVDIHKGQIELDSEVGKGTTFTVSLPQEPR